MSGKPSEASVGPVVSGPRLAVACAAVRRIPLLDQFTPDGETCKYEVCLVQEGRGGLYAFPHSIVGLDQEPKRAAMDQLREQTNLIGTAAYPLTAQGNPLEAQHTITIFYVIPVAHDGSSATQSATFHSLKDVLDNKDMHYPMVQGHREMLYALDQWLKERHAIPFVNPDLVFLCSQEPGEGVGGLVKAIIDNPIYNAQIRPPEDELVISLNNPVFQMSSSHDLDTAVRASST